MKGFFAAVLLLLLLGLTETLSAHAAAPEATPVPQTRSAVPRDPTQTGPQGDTTLKPAYSGADASFFKDGAAAGLAEVAAGRLAGQRAADARVKQFGQQMVKDHTQANAQLQALAKRKGITLPTAPDAGHQKALQELKGLPEVSAFASKTLPTLHRHLDMIEGLARS